MEERRLPSCVIFDLDGTLVDSSPDIRAAIAGACTASGIDDITAGMIGAIVIGPPLPQMIRELAPHLSEQQHQGVVGEFRRLYDVSPLTGTVVYPGVPEILHQLMSSGTKLLVTTNKPELAALRVLEKTGLRACFLDVVTPDLLPGPNVTKGTMVRHLIEKWKLNPNETWMVGDAAGDILAAQENGLRSAAVLSGYGNIEELISAAPTVLVDSIGRLLNCEQFHL